MSNKLFERISNLSMYGYYDPSKNMVVVHFFSEEGDKPDIMAYLKADMSWDVRETVDESSVLEKNKEVVTIYHKSLGVCNKDSQFDKFIREGLTGIAKEMYEDGENYAEKNKLFAILENNSYGN